MTCEVEQIADCGDISSIARALYIPEKEDTNWLSQCSVSLSSCGSLVAIGYKNRLCLLATQWISSTDSNTFLIVWSGTLPADIAAILALSICPSQHSSQNGPDWFCIIVGFKNGSVGFYTNTGHLLLLEKLEDKPVMKISCHTGTYGTLPDDIHILFQNCECIITGTSLFQTLKNAKAQLARVQAGILNDYTIESRNINIRKWTFTEQEIINDAAVVGLELKNTYDHLLAASTYGGYDTWYRSIPPVNSLILGAGIKPYLGFHYALEGGTTPPLQDVARAVANKIKSALPGWLGGANAENTPASTEPLVRTEPLSMRNGLYDVQRQGTSVVVSPDRRLAAVVDSFGRVSVLDIKRGHLIRLFKGCRDVQCAFVQIFDVDNKKPQLSVVKEIRRAVFLIIYNPRKGLIDIRLMQRGNRVAVFTATKNGQLLYNTCGLVGAEKNYTHKKLNLPEFQCVLIDPDGKLKRFNIPFFYALDGEHSQRSKDLHTLRELRDYIKKTSSDYEYYQDEIVKRATELKTMELKKHCLEMLIRNYEIDPKIVISCVVSFWNSFSDQGTSGKEEEMKYYFANLTFLTLFYRRIHNEIPDDMEELVSNINNTLSVQENKVLSLSYGKESPTPKFHLLEDDNCILEKLLHLSQENYYKEHQHAKVKFADRNLSTFKEFVSCFILEGKSKYISLKPDSSAEKLNSLASDTFKTIYKLNNLTKLSEIIIDSYFDPKEILKLVIIHVNNMPLEEISVELIEKSIAVLYYISSVSEEATRMSYNEISPWWQEVRDMLVDMPCPLRSMIVAMACKGVGRLFENNSSDEDAWESLTKENAKWGILIGKLEDISILSIVLIFKENFNGDILPKLQFEDYNINLKFIYTRGKGSVTELIAKWLCSMGVPPEAIIVNELIDKQTSLNRDRVEPDADSSPIYPFLENNRKLVDDNPRIFKWLSLLCRQFPLSTSTNYIIANMSWEYAMAWQKNMQNTNALKAINSCLMNISDFHLRLGLMSIIWSTYIKHIFEVTCRLVNKVGRLPKDPLCLQDVGFSNTNLLSFLELTTVYLSNFLKCASMSISQEKQVVQFEKIWDDSVPSLVEVAQDIKNVNSDILNLNYQISCTIYYQCNFNLKFSKPLDTLYDIDYQYIFEALTGNVVNREINMIASEKIRNPRFKFITKLIRAAIETITTIDSNSPFKEYNDEECVQWIDKISTLSDLWNIDVDFLRRQQVIGLYHLGYDSLAENIIGLINEPELIMSPILAISTQRLKRSLEHSKNQPEWIVTVTPHLYKRLQNTALDTSIPAHPSLSTTVSVLQKMLFQCDKKSTNSPSDLQNIKLAELIIENCEVLLKRKL
ncbi:rab3 GTPase-activating protein non-catalytic subunit-like [Achroia grisella]|uniref:rab3 GTPase-activating protein non-catalytic subunit-like n=1 Tax=Achroia grisella TaxID=688607 RepID=UPI0027D2A162|nr:rab3 GTPase-activating protein non-catalytic subunit-like [Achroia grisella]